MPFVFPIVGVLPGTPLSVSSVPVDEPHMAIGELGPRGAEQGMPVSPASPVPLQDFSLVIGELSPDKSQGSLVLLGTPMFLEDISPSSPMIVQVLPEWPTLDFEELGPYDKVLLLPVVPTFWIFLLFSQRIQHVLRMTYLWLWEVRNVPRPVPLVLWSFPPYSG